MKRSVNAWPLHNQDNEVDPCHLRCSKSQILFLCFKNYQHNFPYLVCCRFRWKLDWWRIYPMLWWPQHPGRQVRLDWRHWNRSMPTQSLGRFPWSSSHFHHGKWWHRICNTFWFFNAITIFAHKILLCRAFLCLIKMKQRWRQIAKVKSLTLMATFRTWTTVEVKATNPWKSWAKMFLWIREPNADISNV